MNNTVNGDLPDVNGDVQRAEHSLTGDTGRPHVVVIGAGFAGLDVAKELTDTECDVTLVDRNNYHKFQPLLYEVAMAGLEPDDIAHNVRHIFQDADNVTFRLGTVCGIDADGQRVEIRGSDPIAYDYLVMAAGAVSNDFGIDGVKEHGFPLKNVPDAVSLRNHVLRQFERYDRNPNAVEEGALNFVIVGGGPTGVEMAGALVELFDTLNEDFQSFDTREVARCILLEMEDHLLPPYEPSLRQYTRKVLERRGVEVRTGTVVDRVTEKAVMLKDGTRIPTQTLVWAAGVQASPVAGFVDAAHARDGRLIVNPDLSVADRPNVFAVGDMAAMKDEEDSDSFYPQLAQVAMQSGRHAARQILNRIRERETEAFSYTDLGQMATIGRNAAVAELPGGIKLKGFLAWVIWVFIHIAKLVGFRNRLSAFINWGYNYFTYSRSARLILDMVPIDDDIPLEVEEVDQKIRQRLKEVEA
ncbi:proton-conducting membrane transporter [Longibacter salinarum]|uniref:NADH:ubiquinone reductase (non-electrogenic) n=1 Tax=Longibacter salinarum TaxID=1850348 RepID=A0A2A8D0J8_9BACT|nr:NAD(P)/FAD-dependent oxidoreductase [Longibacter salinarum]PEN14414.1 proton-conducting membrane transporter [Longibacter salinarum]